VAVRSGADLMITVPSPGGVVSLPSLGRLIGDDFGPTTELSIAEGRVTARGHSDGWQPLRSVNLSGTPVALEDIETYRDCYGAPVTGRLSDADASVWQAELQAAWDSMEKDAPGYRPTVAGALRSVVPLVASDSGERSATYREAYGAVAIARPDDPDALAALMIHELQHVKLGAVLDQCNLVEPGFAGRVRVAWREDLRPVEGALQGAYAHLALADLHRGRQARRPESEARYAVYRQWTVDAVAAILASGGLTPAGTRFLDLMAQTVQGWGTVL
jgi:uncharacterized protein